MISETTFDPVLIKRTPITGNNSNGGSLIRNSGLLWSKVKSKASPSSIPTSPPSSSSSTSSTPNNNNSNGFSIPAAPLSVDLSDPSPPKVLKDFGPNGEVILGYTNSIEIWDWIPTETTRNSKTLPDGSLFLVAKYDNILEGGRILRIYPIVCDRLNSVYKVLAIVKNIYKELQFSIVEVHAERLTDLPFPISTNNTNFSVKAIDSNDYFVISNNTTGELTIFLKSNYSILTTVSGLNSKIINSKSVFDLKGAWLVYNASSQDRNLSKYLSMNGITPLKLSKQTTLINKFWKSLSRTAIDSFLLISEISHSKFKQYFTKPSQGQQQQRQQQLISHKLSNKSKDVDEEEELLENQNFREILLKILNTLNVNSNYLLAIDLSTAELMFCFSPPEGCSAISFSPYDLLLSTVTSRGDDIYIWDFSKFNRQITLMEKFRRGKTSSVIDSVLWGSNNKSISLLSKANGSIHCFNNEFLFEFSSDDKPPPSTSTTTKLNHSFSNPNNKDNNNDITGYNWCLSNSGFKKIALLNTTPELESEMVTIDEKSTMFVINADTGSILAKLSLPSKPIPEKPVYLGLDRHISASQSSITLDLSYDDQYGELDLYPDSSIDPLSQVEIETCKPFSSLYNNRRIQFSTFVNEADDETLGIKLDTFGDILTEYKDLKFGRFNGDVKFSTNRSHDLVRNGENSTECLDNANGGVITEGLEDLRDAMESKLYIR